MIPSRFSLLILSLLFFSLSSHAKDAQSLPTYSGTDAAIAEYKDIGQTAFPRTFQWGGKKFPVLSRISGDGTHETLIQLTGVLKESGTGLSINNQPVKLDAQGGFSVLQKAESRSIQISITTTDSHGVVASRVVTFDILQWDQLHSRGPPKNWSVAPGVGYTYISYRQTGTGLPAINFTQNAITLKVQTQTWIQKGKWNFSGSGFYNCLPFGNSSAPLKIQFIGLNARVGYVLQSVPKPWDVTISGGVYYLSSIVTGDFGFTGVGGPSLYPTVSRTFSDLSSVFLYLKFSPITSGKTFLSLANNETALGTGYAFLVGGKMLGLTLDMSQLNLNLMGTVIASNSYSLSASYSF